MPNAREREGWGVGGGGEIEADSQRERQTDRQKEKDTHRQAGRQTDRQTNRDRSVHHVWRPEQAQPAQPRSVST